MANTCHFTTDMFALQDSSEETFSAISPRRELGAYEALFLQEGSTFKTVAEKFAKDKTALPSDFVPPEKVNDTAKSVIEKLHQAVIREFGVCIN